MREKANGDRRASTAKMELSDGGRSIFCIRTCADLLRLCHLLIVTGYDGPSSVYWDGDDQFYYLIAAEGILSAGGLPRFPALREFSCFSFALPHFIRLAEHCQAVCYDNAVEILGKLA